MKRVVRTVIWAALFSGAVAAGLWVAANFAPERIRIEAERALSELLGDAKVGSVALGWSGGPALVAGAIEVLEGDEVILLLDRVELGLDLLRLLRGEGRFDRLEVSGLSLRVRRLANGDLRPARLAKWLRSAGETDRPRPLGLRVVSIREGHLVLSDEGDTPSTLEFDQVTLELLVRPSLEIDAHGRMEGSPFTFQMAGPRDAQSFHASLDRTRLGPLYAWLDTRRELDGEVAFSVEGRAGAKSGSFIIERLDVELAQGSLDGRSLPALSVSGGVDLDPEQVRLSGVRFVADALVLHANAVVPREIQPNSVLDGSVITQRVRLDTLLEHVESLGLDAAVEPLSRVDSGVIDSLQLSAEALSWEALQTWLRSPTRWPAGLELAASFHDVSVIPDEGEPIRDLKGRLVVDETQLALREISAKLGRRPLPHLELEIDGWGRVAETWETSPTLRAVAPLYGRAALTQWVEARSHPREPRWTSARVELDWLDHPALLRPLERAAATLRPLRPGIGVDLHGARWGGVWLSGSGLLSGEGDTLNIRLALTTHSSAPAKLGDRVTTVVRNTPMRRVGSAWSAGRAQVELRELGGFGASQLKLSFDAEGSALRTQDLSLALEPTGRVTGRVELDLGEAESVPYRASFQLSDGDLSAILEDLGASGTLTTGRLVLAADLSGHLRPGEAMRVSLRGPLSAHARDGLVLRRVPWALAIAQVSETFNPFRSRESLRYDAIDANFRFEEDRVDSESISVTGPTLRMVATGSLHFETPNRLEAVVGLFFFRGIDKVLGTVPILNTLLLGSDENLVPAYFSLEGPWAAPKARIIPMKSFLAGPANIVVEGVPSFVRGGLNQLGRLFSLRPSEAEATESPDPAEAGP